MLELLRKINVEPAVFLFLFGVYLMDLPGRWVFKMFNFSAIQSGTLS